MSTSLLYHAFGVRGYEYTRTDYQGGQTIFTIHQAPETCRCSACGSPQVHSRGRVERRFRTVPIGSRPTFVVLPIPRVECQDCGVVRQVEISFADPRRSYTSSFERYALELSRSMTIREVARHLDVSWDTIKDIQKRDLSRRYAKPKLKHLRQLAIDEIAVAKGHRYLTIVMDLKSGAVVFVGDGKGAEALKPFWKRLRPSKAVIEAVAMDMAAACRGAVSAHLPARPNPVTAGDPVLLTASNLADTNPGSTITQVAFYVDSNGSGVLDPGDTLLVGTTNFSNGTFTLTFSTTGWSAGSKNLFAVAVDNDGVFSDSLATTVSVI